VLRGSDELEVLAFRHPLAGLQLVKGTIEQGETAREAALRELGEESGIHNASIVADLGFWESGYEGQVWSFHLCQVSEDLPDAWVHHAPDDGGRDFHFFWYRLSDKPTKEWADVFRAALSLLRGILL
jgi:8-oxo-dGTP pyrophosphatase MutT (NUDIX family)